MKRKLTIRRLLQESKHLNFTDIPYFKEIVVRLPEEADIRYHDTCDIVLEHLIALGATKFLNMKIEDILVENEGRITRCLIRWSFFTGIIGSFAILAVVTYLALVNREMPDLWLTVVLVAIPAGIMWTQAGVLRGENAEGIGRILGHAIPGFKRKPSRRPYTPSPYEEEEDLDYTPPRQHYDLDEDIPRVTRRVRRPQATGGLDDE